MRVRLLHGPCEDVLPTLESDSVDSVVCDPPYELGFMGKSWDRSGIAYNVEVWRECLRVLKAGGHLLAFGGSRTYHRLACAVEDAGFEIRDQIQWLYGSGFPKSLDVSKAIDSGGRPEDIRRMEMGDGYEPSGRGRINYDHGNGSAMNGASTSTRIQSDAAKQWDGWGTALKPAQEILTVAYKPHEHEGERDKIGANLLLLEARLWSLLPASVAETSFKLSQSEYDAVCASAQCSAEERHNTRAALCAQMGTSRFLSGISTSLNTVRSWRHLLDELCEEMSTCTTETRTSLITDLRILNCLLSRLTLSTIIEAASQVDGRALSALPVVQHFDAARLKLNGIQMLFAHDAATSKAHTLRRGATESNGIVLARKPLIGTVAENVLKHGTGGLNIDGCRIEGEPTHGSGTAFPTNRTMGTFNGELRLGVPNIVNSQGRWPANVIHDGSEEVLAGFPETGSGVMRAGTVRAANDHPGSVCYGTYGGNATDADTFGDFGSAARFFYCAKASKEDREEGLESVPTRSAGSVTDRKDGSDGLNSPRAGAGRTNGSRNHHPTVKPTDLMRYLCRLVTPPNGIVLDPFCGSGSTGKAAMLEGLNFIGIDKDAEYVEMAQLRIEAATRQGLLF